MPENVKDKLKNAGRFSVSALNAAERRKKYRVILEGIETEIETPESFAIKFSLACKVPVTKINHIMRKLPATLWVGQGKSRAQRLLSLIVEAGGIGRIVEEKPAVEEVAPEEKGKKDETVCLSCGFPLKEEDKFCEFCLTPVGEVKPSETHVKIARPPAVPKSRLIFYIALIIVLFIIALALR